MNNSPFSILFVDHSKFKTHTHKLITFTKFSFSHQNRTVLIKNKRKMSTCEHKFNAEQRTKSKYRIENEYLFCGQEQKYGMLLVFLYIFFSIAFFRRISLPTIRPNIWIKNAMGGLRVYALLRLIFVCRKLWICPPTYTAYSSWLETHKKLRKFECKSIFIGETSKNASAARAMWKTHHTNTPIIQQNDRIQQRKLLCYHSHISFMS